MPELKILLDGQWVPALPAPVPGPPGPQGPAGVAGPAGAVGLPGGAIPAGGALGEYLVKASGVDYATAWDVRPVSTGRILHKTLQGPWNGTTNSSFTVTLEARPYLLMFTGQGHSAAVAARDVYMQMDGVLIGNARLWFNVTVQHNTFDTATVVINPTAGSHTFTLHNGGGVTSDTNDYGFVLLLPI